MADRPVAGRAGGVAVVLGTGSIGRRHLSVLPQAGFDRVVAVPVRQLPANSTVDGFRVEAAIPDGADLVVIATDTARHVRDALTALERGAGTVLVEKPVAAWSEDAQPLLTHERADRVRVSAPLRFHEGLGRVRALIDTMPGPWSVRAASQSWLPEWRPSRPFRESYSVRATEGGVLRDLVHEIDYAVWLFGAPVKVLGSVALTPSPVLDIESDESADLLWSTSDGSAVSIRIDYVSRPPRRELVVRSAAGEISWDAREGRVRMVAPQGDVVLDEQYPADREPSTALGRQAAALNDFAVGGSGSRLATLEDAVSALRIGECIRPRPLEDL